MKITVSCSGCGNAIASEENGRLPPWCSKCGATLKKSADAPRPAAPAPDDPGEPAPATAAARAEVAEATPLQTLPFFHACAPAFFGGEHELFRAYLADGELLVLRLGVGDVNHGTVQPRTKARQTGTGVAGGMAYLAEMKKMQLAKRIEELDLADEAALRMHAAASGGGFVAGAADLRDVHIDPPSWWYRVACGVEHYAVLKFTHAQEGGKSLALPALGDVRRAVEGLTERFGDLVQVNLTWGSAARRGG